MKDGGDWGRWISSSGRPPSRESSMLLGQSALGHEKNAKYIICLESKMEEKKRKEGIRNGACAQDKSSVRYFEASFLGKTIGQILVLTHVSDALFQRLQLLTHSYKMVVYPSVVSLVFSQV